MYQSLAPTFWVKLIILMSVFLLLLFSFNFVMRKLLKVERKKFFSYNHVNEKHAKMDWTIRGSFIVAMIIGYLINIRRIPYDSILFLEPWFILLIFLVASESARAFMEWKYAENRNDYIFTICQMIFMALFLLAVFTTGILEWF